MGGYLLLLGAGLALLGCEAQGIADFASTGGARDAGLPDAEVVPMRHEQALYGEVVPRRCNRWQKQRIREVMTAGRMLASSSAFAACVEQAMRVGDIEGPDGIVGPYQACKKAMTPADPHPGAALPAKIEHALAATRSPFGIRIECSNGNRAREGLLLGSMEYVKIMFGRGEPAFGASLESAASHAKMVWHEVMHNWGYKHNDYRGGRSCTQDDFGNSIPYIVQGCMGLVAEASSELCAERTCEGPRIPIITNYPVDVRTGCECVRDVVSHAPVLGESQHGAQYGGALAAGDFNGDRFADMAVGAPGENDGTGAVYLYRGSEFGLQPWRVLRGTEPEGAFGSALAAGDLSGDGQDDLAIGAPGSSDVEGYVYLYRGDGDDGLAFVRRLDQQGLDKDERGDFFGLALAIGSIFGSGLPGLVVGAPGEQVAKANGAGLVYVFAGTADDALVVSRYALSQEGADAPEHGDAFGASLALGAIDLDRAQDIVVGAPFDKNVGRAYVFMGVSRSALSNPARFALAPSSPEEGMQYGAAVAVAKVGAAGSSRIAVGAPQALGGRGKVYLHAGIDHVPTSLAAAGSAMQMGRLDTVLNGALDDGGFGAALERLLLEPQRSDEQSEQLVVGAPGQQGGRVRCYGPGRSGTELRATHDQRGLGINERGDELGAALASGDFDHDNRGDWIAGAPGEAPRALPASGAVFHLKGEQSGSYIPFRFYHQAN